MTALSTAWDDVKRSGLPDVRPGWGPEEFAAYGLLQAIANAQARGLTRDRWLAIACDLSAGLPKAARDVRDAAKV